MLASTYILPELLQLIRNLPVSEQRTLYRELMKKPIKRKHLRMASNLEVGYVVDGKEYTDQMKDMSYEGLFIETNRSFSVGQKVKLEIPIANSSRFNRTTGVIVRRTRDGIGIKLTKDKKYED